MFVHREAYVINANQALRYQTAAASLTTLALAALSNVPLAVQSVLSSIESLFVKYLVTDSRLASTLR
jgi:hypothetical protein